MFILKTVLSLLNVLVGLTKSSKNRTAEICGNGMVTNIFYMSVPLPCFSCNGACISQEDSLQTCTLHLSNQLLSILPFFLPPFFNLNPSGLPLSILFHPSLQWPAYSEFLRITSIPGSLFFLTVCFAAQWCCALKTGLFLLEHRHSKCSQPQLAT